MADLSNRFLKPGDLAVLVIRARNVQGAVVYRINLAQSRPFLYGNLSSALSPGNGTTVRLSGTFLGTTISDLLYFTKKNYLLHVVLDVIPKLRVYPYWTSGNLQSDFMYSEGTLPATEDEDWGWLEPPVEAVVIPKAHLDFRLYNPYGTESINPLIKFYWGEYQVTPVRDPDIVWAVLNRKYAPAPKWFLVYGMKPFEYNIETNMGIPELVPLDADRSEIASIVEGWEVSSE